MDEEIRRILRNHEERISHLEKLAEKKPRVISKTKGTEDLILDLIQEGFFSEDKTISQIREALHEKGRIVKRTDMPVYLLKLIRNGKLKRTRKTIEKRKTWVYLA